MHCRCSREPGPGAWLALLLLLLGGAACVKREPTGVVRPAAPAAGEPRAQRARAERAPTDDAPAPEAPTPRLLADQGDEDSRRQAEEILARVAELLGALAERPLTDAQREEREAGVAFVSQAREALEAGDPERAIVLAEKARILIENLERVTRR